MGLKPELKGTKIYIKSLNIDVEVNEENIDLLKSVKAPVFEDEANEIIEFKGIVEEQKNDNNKSRNSKRRVFNSNRERDSD